MTPQVDALFHELADLTRQQRLDYYASHGIDEAVRNQLENLFSFDSEGSDLSVGAAIGQVADRAAAEMEDTSRAGARCGPYRLLDVLGQGGMGVVYRAERVDGEITQQVAIKTLHPAMGRSAWKERFKRERELLARLTHPAIARLYDAGHTEQGLPYLVMEYVDGIPIDQYAAGKSLSDQLTLVAEVCDAVTHAHRNLIIHRDLKPSNILVEKSGHPKLLDFGIAKLLDDPGDLTETVERMLTPSYASPEQFRGDPQTTATDVYSLGAVLFKLTTGHAPHEKGMERTDATPGPRELNRDLPLDVDLIVRKALRPEPGERYPSVESLAGDIRRFLRHEPILARPESLLYRAARFVRRNRAATVLAAVALVASIAGVAATLMQAREARAQRDFAFRQLVRAEELNDLDAFLLSDAAPLGKPFTVNDLLARAERIVERQAAADPVSNVSLLTSIGMQFDSAEMPDRALPILKRAFERSRSITVPSAKARAACAYAMAISETGEGQRAGELLQAGLREIPDEPIYALDRVFCLQRSSAIARRQGAAQEAITTMLAARETLQRAPYHSQVADLSILLDLAESYRVAGRLQDAVVISEQAGALMQALGRDDTQRAGTLFNNWALALNLLGRELEAERVYRRAIEINKSDDRERTVSPMLLLNYGRVLSALGRHREAGDYVNRASQQAHKSGLELVALQSMFVQNTIRRNLGDVAGAERVMDQLEPMSRRLYPAGHVVFASAASQRSLNALAGGDVPAALQMANRAVSLTEECIKARQEGLDFLPTLLFRRSEIQYKLKNMPGASADGRRSLDLLKKQIPSGSFSSDLGRAYLALGRAVQTEGDVQQAKGLFRSAAEHLRHSLGAEHLLTTEAARLAGS